MLQKDHDCTLFRKDLTTTQSRRLTSRNLVAMNANARTHWFDGKRLARYCKENGVSRKWIAGQIGCKPSLVYNWCQSVSNPRPEVLAKLVEVTGVGADEWLVERPFTPRRAAQS